MTKRSFKNVNRWHRLLKITYDAYKIYMINARISCTFITYEALFPLICE